jgi:cellulose synthase/poly-beta-1,6-N-acetylglucosamine synthase-like glycosyltransferase
LHTTWLSALLLIPGTLLSVFVVYQLLFAVLSLCALVRKRPLATNSPTLRFVVIVPAHNEEGLIGGAVRSILASTYPAFLLDLVVIADNCTDATAANARAAGARCLERFDTALRGKPYALDWAIGQLDLNCYDAFVIIDSDTHVHADFLQRMADHLCAGQVALQGYFGVLNPDQTWLTRLSLIPAALKFRLHFPGKELAGLSCPLAGNGMCFHIDLIRSYGWKAYSLTENWEYWTQLVLQGIRTGAAPDAIIYSQVAKSLSSGRSQRLRWMKGRIDTLARYGGRLLAAGLCEPSAMKFDAALELARPSHALLFFWSLVYAGLAVPLGLSDTAYRSVAWLAVGLVAVQLACFLVAFVWSRPPPRAWLALVMVPWYLAWKIVISFGGLLTIRERNWVRTRRNE